jgi:hypothetical protein
MTNYGDAYTVVITDSNGCTATSSPILLTGIASYTDGGYHVYPNPAKDVLTVEGKGMVKCELYNVLGQHYLTSLVSDGKTVTHLSTQNIPNGIYFLRITNSSGEQHTERVIVNK